MVVIYDLELRLYDGAVVRFAEDSHQNGYHMESSVANGHASGVGRK
jgi:hypothetical protein